jgi:hypothetical protein
LEYILPFCATALAATTNMRKQLIYIAIGVILIASHSSHATTVERLSLEQMTKKARAIVVGKVTRSHSYWDGRIILTTHTVNVQETIKGQAARTLEVTTVGGTVGDTTLHVAGMPAFHAGEDAVVFVEQSGRFSTVVGLAQGKFNVERGEVRNNVGELAFPDGRRGEPLRLPLSTFKQQIKTILDQ